MACNSIIEALLTDRGVDLLPSPELPTVGATRAWAARMKERWVDLEKKFKEELDKLQMCGDNSECCKSSVRSEGSLDNPANLDSLQDHSSVKVEEAEVTGLPGSNPIQFLDHHSPPNYSHPLTPSTQVSSLTPRTASSKPLKQKENTALS